MRVKAEEKASVLLTQAEGQRKIIVNEVRAETITSVNEAKAAAQRMVIDAEKQAKVLGIEAESEFVRQQAAYAALRQECEAESSNLAAINAERQHTYEMNKAAAFEGLANGKRTKFVMSGSAGENLINKIFSVDK